MKRFALIGAAGYIAPRHFKAIKETGNILTAALDPASSVGIIDHYFPDAEFFTDPEVFEAHLEDHPVDWVAIASPNYLHEAHIRLAFRLGAQALCEKPLVLETEALDRLVRWEQRVGRRVFTVLQLRLHPALVTLKERLGKGPYTVDLTYITDRGRWFAKTWKAEERKSGGLATNIGIHFFDLLAWLFGPLRHLEVHVREPRVAAGFLELERARVRWFLSLDAENIPDPQRQKGKRVYRSIVVEGQEVEFSEAFSELHTEVYRRTLAGKGFGPEDVRESIRTVSRIRTLPLSSPSPERSHRLLRR